MFCFCLCSNSHADSISVYLAFKFRVFAGTSVKTHDRMFRFMCSQSYFRNKTADLEGDLGELETKWFSNFSMERFWQTDCKLLLWCFKMLLPGEKNTPGSVRMRSDKSHLFACMLDIHTMQQKQKNARSASLEWGWNTSGFIGVLISVQLCPCPGFNHSLTFNPKTQLDQTKVQVHRYTRKEQLVGQKPVWNRGLKFQNVDLLKMHS